jgi:hypothetical protein
MDVGIEREGVFWGGCWTRCSLVRYEWNTTSVHFPKDYKSLLVGIATPSNGIRSYAHRQMLGNCTSKPIHAAVAHITHQLRCKGAFAEDAVIKVSFGGGCVSVQLNARVSTHFSESIARQPWNKEDSILYADQDCMMNNEKSAPNILR